MQLYLSNLVDLALGNPYNLTCENFNVLHTLLHIILKKLNLTDVCVELDKESMEKVDKLKDDLSQEPLICFKEYHIKTDGTKVKKRDFNLLRRRQSLIHIRKKIPQHSETISTQHLELQNLSNKLDGINERILMIERKISKISTDFDGCLTKEKPHGDNKTSSENVDRNWLKGKIFDLSDSLKLHSNCLKKIKCEELPKVHSLQAEFTNTLRSHSELLQVNNIKEIKNTIESLQKQFLSANERIQRTEAGFEIYKNSTRDEILLQIGKTLESLWRSRELNCQKEKSKDRLKYAAKPFKSSDELEPNMLNDKNDSENQRYESSHISITTTLDEIQKQVSSHSICLHKLVRDLSLKIDRCEFEMYCRQLNDMIDVVMQLKRDVQNSSSAAECRMSMMKDINCMSCQTNVNMVTETTLQEIPFFKFGQAKDVSRKKYKRMNTPHKCLTPLYKNRYRVYPYYRNV